MDQGDLSQQYDNYQYSFLPQIMGTFKNYAESRSKNGHYVLSQNGIPALTKSTQLDDGKTRLKEMALARKNLNRIKKIGSIDAKGFEMINSPNHIHSFIKENK